MLPTNLFDSTVIQPLISIQKQWKDRIALKSGEEMITYDQLNTMIQKIRSSLRNHAANERIVGIVDRADGITYAAILAVWMEGKCYVPLNSSNSISKNSAIVDALQLKCMIDSSSALHFEGVGHIVFRDVEGESIEPPKIVDDGELAYIMFTSGTTGGLKAVQITRFNLASFIQAFQAMNISVNPKDRILQMFDLTFDLSLFFLVSFLKGATLFPIPKEVIKYQAIAEIMEDEEITIALMVPSVLQYWRNFFHEFQFPALHTNLFCGEALPLDVTTEWQRCVPNAEIYNVYGPTEDTIFCTAYPVQRIPQNKAHNGVLSIGKSMLGNSTILVDEHLQEIAQGQIGELCLGGNQLTPGYLMNHDLNQTLFFEKRIHGVPARFYKSGDLCFKDEEGDLFFIGRVDSQVKIQGFRVETSEVEFYANSYLKPINSVVVAFQNALDITELGLVIESPEFDTTSLRSFLSEHLPFYMVPSKIAFTPLFPLNANGKIDRKQLKANHFSNGER